MTNPIKNEKSKLAFRGIFIKENTRQANILNKMAELEKTLQLVNEYNNQSGKIRK
jgi:hypothetical protein